MKRTTLRKKGLTLMEIMVVMGLVALVAYLSLSALSGTAPKGASHGLAIAVKEQFEAARQTAIQSGQPVALGIPTDNGSQLAGCSMYRLQGWNTPYVKWSGGFHGDYPGAGFAAATWGSTPGLGGPVSLPNTAKYFNFGQPELLAWLPNENENDYVFCFLPDGSLFTNGLPTSNGRYPIVVAQAPSFTGSAPGSVSISNGTEPWTVFVSPGGGVEIVKGTPGGTLPPGSGSGSVSTPQKRTKNEVQAQIYLSNMKIRPESAGRGHCTPGQVVTLELYAHCPQGENLFANWTQTEGSVNNKLGSFTYPHRADPVPTDPLPGEADRMEFLPPNRIPTGTEAPVWSAGEEPPANTGIFRARWTWTVPLDTEADETFSVTANVQNAQQTAVIVTSPLPSFGSTASPKGKLIVERRVDGRWTLWRMNPDGTNEERLTKEGMEEMMPSVDKHANQMALIRDAGGITQRYIVVRTPGGADERVLAGPGAYTSVSLSPTGDWVAFHEDDLAPAVLNGRLHVVRTNGSDSFVMDQDWTGSGFTIKKGRPGWSTDGRYVLYGHEDGIANPHLYSVRLNDPTRTRHDIFGPFAASTAGISRIFSPCAYQMNGQEYVIISASGDDGFLQSFPVSGNNYEVSSNIGDMQYWGAGDLHALRPSRLSTPVQTNDSSGWDDDYPSVSYEDPPRLIFTASPFLGGSVVTGEDTEDQELYVLSNITSGYPGHPDGVFYGPAEKLVLPDVRRAIFLPAE